MKKNKKIYEAPLLTVVEFRTEKGFADSGSTNFIIQTHQVIDEELVHHLRMGQTNTSGNGGFVAGGMNGNVDHSNDGGSSNWQYSNGGWF